MNYGVNAKAYLRRARQRLMDDTHESLFYAALELRCCVESRQDEYIDAQKEYTTSIPRAWKIGAQGAALKKIYSSNKIQKLTLHFGDQIKREIFHVPVSENLRNQAEKLGNFLHVQNIYRDNDDPWWSDLRTQLQNVYRLAWSCCQGTLICPALLKDGKAIGSLTISPVDLEVERWREILSQGTRLLLKVEYLETVPAEWVCDIDDIARLK